MIESKTQTSDRGMILFDANFLKAVEVDYFDPNYWREFGQVSEPSAGRGSAWLVSDDKRDWVLRHYQRGGLVAKLSRDQYWFTGAERTRAFVEWRLLAELHQQGLPVPQPIAARYQRHRLTYRADLIVARLPSRETLAQRLLSSGQPDWASIGRCIGQFHRVGVCHADLNAHNIMLADDRVYLIDFDRGRRRRNGRWQQANLQRLDRSIHKVLKAQYNELASTGWAQLQSAYRSAMQ